MKHWVLRQNGMFIRFTRYIIYSYSIILDFGEIEHFVSLLFTQILQS